jgi:hypothetical protein
VLSVWPLLLFTASMKVPHKYLCRDVHVEHTGNNKKYKKDKTRVYVYTQDKTHSLHWRKGKKKKKQKDCKFDFFHFTFPPKRELYHQKI